MRLSVKRTSGLWAAILFLVALVPGQAHAWVHNTSDHVIWIKPEFSDTPVRLAPGERYDEATQDGVAAPHLQAKKIYKTVDRCSAEIDNAGINTKCEGLIPNLADFVGYGGWKGRDWLGELQNASNNGWAALFEKAGVF